MPKIVSYEKTGLTHPTTYYWRFYARTNTDPKHAEATAISEVFTASTVAAPVSQFRNTTGEYFSDYYTIDNWAYFLQNQSFTTNSDHPLVAGLQGQEIRPQLTAAAYTLQDAKKIVEWFTSVTDPQIETLYPISHTFEYYDSTETMIYQMVDVSDAEIMYAVNGFNQLTIFIVGGLFAEQSPYIQGVFGNSGDFKSTSG